VKIVSFIALAFISLTVVWAQSNPRQEISVVEKDRTDWINLQVTQLKTYDSSLPGKEIPWKQSYRNDRYVTSCRVTKSGLLRMGTSNWVYVVSNSSHERPEVGDIVLAIDSQGRIYQHDGHVCGGIINFRSVDLDVPATSDDFFLKFTDDVAELPWRSIHEKSP